MSWQDFLETKQFGKPIFRPYADLLGDISNAIDTHLATDPAFARWFVPLAARDIIFAHTPEWALILISGTAHRHLPFRLGGAWTDVYTVTPPDDFSQLPYRAEGATALRDVSGLLAADLHFSDVVGIVVPSTFIAARDSPEWVVRSRAVAAAANIIIDRERTRFERLEQMAKPKDIFLSHKSVDKDLVREIARTLVVLGFSPWLDEDRMVAGVNLERALLTGLDDSCAAVFFITPNFIDEGYLATEVDYAIAQKRAKGDRFSIITLVIPASDGTTNAVPALLRPYVWKQVQPVTIVRSIVEALPIRPGAVEWKVE